MALLPQWKNARRSLKHKLFVYMAALAVLLVAALCAGLLVFGRLSSPRSEMSRALDMQMEVFVSDMTALWRNVSAMGIHLSEDMTYSLEEYLTAQNMSFADLSGSADDIRQLEDVMLEPLCQYVRQADCSGAFVLLNTSLKTDPGDSRCGLYVQKSNAEQLTNDLLLYRGVASVGKAHGVMPHRKWAQEFDTEVFPSYAGHMAAASAPIERSCRTTDLITLPGTSERAVLLTVPLLGADGTVYGLCGFSVEQTYFASHHEQPSNLDHLACLFTAPGAGLDAGAGLVSYTADGFCYVPEETLTVSEMKNGLLVFTGTEFSFVGKTAAFAAANGDSTPHTLAVLVPQEDFSRAVAKSALQTVVLTALLLFFSVVCCLHLTRQYVSPLLRDLERLKAADREGQELSFRELEPLSDSIRARQQAHEQIVTALEGEKQDVQQRLEEVQTDAARLAYSRKTEVDPVAYQVFRQGMDKLTASEREVFQALASGTNAKGIAAQMGRSEGTVRTHIRNIYDKLDVHSAKQLRLYAALMRQEDGAQV